MSWPGALRLLLSFALCSAVVALLQPLYAELVASLAGGVLKASTELGHGIEAWLDYPQFHWRSSAPDLAGVDGSISLRLVTYNLALYLSTLAAIADVDLRRRLLWIAWGVPILLLWQTGDVLLTIQSQWLTLVRPQAYDVTDGVDLWFLAVKYANNFNALAGRQLVPFAIFAAQWWRWRLCEADQS